MEAVTTEQSAVLALRGIGKIYGRGTKARHAVTDVSLTAYRGEVYGFLGPNGAGKSTTIRMILGLIRPTSGQISLFGEPPCQRGPLSRVGSLVDGGAFYPFLSGRQNLRVLARTRGIGEGRIDELLHRVDLGSDGDLKVKRYSLGMRQRLGVAAALLSDPELVILDEPANGLDAAGIQDMRTLIRGLADEGKAVFLSSHLLHEVEQVCDRIAIVAKGRLLQETTIAGMLAQDEVMVIEAEPSDRALRAIEGEWATSTDGSALRVSASRAQVPTIVRRLVEAEVAIYQVRSHRQSLEEAFLTMTRDDDD
jgi:ABC-2 type transport system ATP-binding protein